MELIDSATCIGLLTRYNATDNAEDIKLVRYYETEDALIVLIKYKTVDLKCVIDRATITDLGNKDMTVSADFVKTYLIAPMPVLSILGEESSDINLIVSKV